MMSAGAWTSLRRSATRRAVLLVPHARLVEDGKVELLDFGQDLPSAGVEEAAARAVQREQVLEPEILGGQLAVQLAQQPGQLQPGGQRPSAGSVRASGSRRFAPVRFRAPPGELLGQVAAKGRRLA